MYGAEVSGRLHKQMLVCLAGVLVLLALLAPIAGASSPKPGTYTAITTQCGSATLSHPCYGFSIHIAKGSCVAPGAKRKRAGYCVSFSHKVNASMVLADVTCPDAKTFQSRFTGPLNPFLLSPSGTLHFSAHSDVTEAGREIVVEIERLSMTVNGIHVSGTLTDLTQEQIGLEAPQCTTGTVSFTARRA